MIFPPDITEKARDLLAAARERRLRLGTIESCTGGLIAAALTEIPGSSDVFERGFVTYSNEAKAALGVPLEILQSLGAVSAQTAGAMTQAALDQSSADAVVAVTGIAGPGGGTAEKPVGLVYLAAATRAGELQILERKFGDLGRSEIRLESVRTALSLLAGVAGVPAQA